MPVLREAVGTHHDKTVIVNPQSDCYYAGIVLDNDSRVIGYLSKDTGDRPVGPLEDGSNDRIIALADGMRLFFHACEAAETLPRLLDDYHASIKKTKALNQSLGTDEPILEFDKEVLKAVDVQVETTRILRSQYNNNSILRN